MFCNKKAVTSENKIEHQQLSRINMINQELDKFWALVIKSIEYDMFGGNVTIHLEDENSEQFNIKMLGVSALMWIRDNDNEPIGFTETLYKELTSIQIGTAKINLSEDKWLKQFSLIPNICIEIMSSALLIKAKEIKINNKSLIVF